jgi:hypothetical protein
MTPTCTDYLLDVSAWLWSASLLSGAVLVGYFTAWLLAEALRGWWHLLVWAVGRWGFQERSYA